MDENYIYVGGNCGRIRKYDKNTLDFVGETGVYGGENVTSSWINSIFVDENYIYAGGNQYWGDSTYHNPLCKYDKNTMMLIGETGDYGDGITSITVDERHIYVGGGAIISRVRKYDKETLAFIGETQRYGSAIESITLDEKYLYVGGLHGGEFPTQRAHKYDKETLAFIGWTDDYVGIIHSIAVDDRYIYLGGGPPPTRLRKYDKETLTFVSEAGSYGGEIRSVFAPGPVVIKLEVNSSPITGVSFAIDGLSFVTPFSSSMDEGTYTITMPQTIAIGGVNYEFVNWADGVTTPSRMINLIADMSLTANYKAVVPTHTVTMRASPEVGVPATVDGKVIGKTPVYVEVVEGDHVFSVPSEVEV